MTDRYAVFGNPIEHSLSPLIHSEFAKQTGQDVDYQRKLIPIDTFESSVKEFFSGGGRGLNITVPFKLEAYRIADKMADRARLAGAVNTLYYSDRELVGDNTDGVGLCNDLQNNLGWSLRGARVLVLGAGGAVRGVLLPMLEQKPAQLIIANRTQEKADELVAQFADRALAVGTELRSISFNKLHQPFDTVINGTSAGLGKQMPDISPRVVKDSCCYDMVYGARPTAFMQWATTHAATQVADGLGMLVEQAAESFLIWRGVRPETRPVIEKIRASL